MSQKEDNLKFKKLVNKDSKRDLQIQRDNIKTRIMDEYNVSADDAKKILFQIEKKEAEKNKKKNNKVNNHSNIIALNYISDEKISNEESKNSITSEIDNIPNKTTTNIQKKSSNPIEKVLKDKSSNNTHNIKLSKNESFINQQEINEKQNRLILDGKEDSLNNYNEVDSILGDIIPNFNQQISIKVDHVDLTFEVSNEKVDTLKETFIRAFKRNKSKKIKIHALKDVSFQIYKGEKVGIIGYNGAGKSTLLNVIAGIYPPDNGDVCTYGKISPLLSLGAGFDHNFSGRRNIIINGAVLGYDKKFLESKIDEIIEFSELGEFIDVPIKNYSSGMLAKLGFSIAAMVNPDILIIDEILGVGDVNFIKKSRDKIRSLMDGGTTVLLVSHSIPQIRELCDKAIWIDNGSVRTIGEVNKVCDEYLKDAERASNEQLANIQLVNK